MPFPFSFLRKLGRAALKSSGNCDKIVHKQPAASRGQLEKGRDFCDEIRFFDNRLSAMGLG